jgi:HAD superfamily hydrolase (TIGR01549 family)
MNACAGVVFDLDGTLVDSGLNFDLMRQEMGLPEGHAILEALAEVPAGPEKQTMLHILAQHEATGAVNATLIDGVADVLSLLQECQIPVAVLTRNSRQMAMRMLQKFNIAVSQLVAREDAPPKPDPAGLFLIAERWSLPTKRLLMCGDYKFDLEAGRAAGMITILYAPGVRPQFADLADYVIERFADSLPLWRELIGTA